MSISINSMNSVLGQSYNAQANSAAQSTDDSEASKEVDKIREQMRALENELLQMQSETDASEQSEDTKEQLEEQLEELKQELKTAEAKAASSAQASTAATTSTTAVSSRPRFDKYEKGTEESQSLGIYTIKPNGEKGYDISYEPYSQKPKSDVSTSQAVKTTETNADDTDSEIKRLENEKDDIEQKISDAVADGKSEDEIAQLRQKLSTIESEINIKNNVDD